MKFADLFCGIGGFHLALAARGHECVFASDSDDRCREVYRANFGLIPAGDITEIAAEDIPAHDILCGGFPCQPFSTAGDRAGMADSRGTLFFDIARIVKHHRPSICLLENVPNIMVFDGGSAKRVIDASFEELGYRVWWHRLNAAEYGAATARTRAYIVATRKDTGLVSHRPKPTGERDCVARHLRPDLVDAGRDMFGGTGLSRSPDDYVFVEPRSRNDTAAWRIAYNKNQRENAQGYQVYDPAGPAPTFTAGEAGQLLSCGFYIDGEVRRLHIEEVKTIQGYPPEHVLSPGVAGYNQIGNSVIPKMVGLVFDAIEGVDEHA